MARDLGLVARDLLDHDRPQEVGAVVVLVQLELAVERQERGRSVDVHHQPTFGVASVQGEPHVRAGRDGAGLVRVVRGVAGGLHEAPLAQDGLRLGESGDGEGGDGECDDREFLHDLLLL